MDAQPGFMVLLLRGVLAHRGWQAPRVTAHAESSARGVVGEHGASPWHAPVWSPRLECVGCAKRLDFQQSRYDLNGVLHSQLTGASRLHAIHRYLADGAIVD